MKTFLRTILVQLTLLAFTIQSSQSQGALYVAKGKKSFAAGAILNFNSGFAFGLDFGTDGKKEDSTHGYEKPRNNLVLLLSPGIHIHKEGKTLGFTLLFMIGARQTGTYCPSGDSHLGFRCYANEEPSDEYQAAFGFFGAISGAVSPKNNILLGAKVTDTSTGLALGFWF